MANPGTKLEDVKSVRAHLALPLPRRFLEQHNIEAVSAADSAGAAEELAKLPNPQSGVLASAIAADIYGLDILAQDIEDNVHNTTRFLIIAHTR